MERSDNQSRQPQRQLLACKHHEIPLEEVIALLSEMPSNEQIQYLIVQIKNLLNTLPAESFGKQVNLENGDVVKVEKNRTHDWMEIDPQLGMVSVLSQQVQYECRVFMASLQLLGRGQPVVKAHLLTGAVENQRPNEDHLPLDLGQLHGEVIKQLFCFYTRLRALFPAETKAKSDTRPASE